MTRISKLALTTALVVFALALTTSAQNATSNASCSFTYFTPPSPFTAAFQASGINHYGTVVGQASTTTTVKGWIHFTNGGNSLFEVPGSNTTSFSKRNLSGTTVGYYVPSGGQGTSGLVFTTSGWTTLNHGTFSTQLTGINKFSTIVGSSANSYGDVQHGFRYSSGHFTSIAFPGAAQTVPEAVNDNGVIVGTYTNVNLEHPPHGFVLKSGVYKTMDVPNTSGTQLLDISNDNRIVASPNLIFIGGVWKKVVVPGAFETFVNGVNDVKGVTGVANYQTGPSTFTWKAWKATCN